MFSSFLKSTLFLMTNPTKRGIIIVNLKPPDIPGVNHFDHLNSQTLQILFLSFLPPAFEIEVDNPRSECLWRHSASCCSRLPANGLGEK
mmetsp:Transcript_32137/g.52183  ORF Transcript_32137/g.52183 Transcript_32137/m.52183 type:complete len:89 (-) Transcript_32137:28-294(-)